MTDDELRKLCERHDNSVHMDDRDELASKIVDAVPTLLDRLAAMREFADWCKGSGMPVVEEYAARVLDADDKARDA